MSPASAFERILLCLDLETGSDALAAYAAGLVRQCDGGVHLLHILTHGPDDGMEARALKRLGELTRDRLGGAPVARTEVRSGIPEDEILRYVDAHQIDLIVLGHRPESVERIHVGSTTRAVISLSSRPVLVVPLD